MPAFKGRYGQESIGKHRHAKTMIRLDMHWNVAGWNRSCPGPPQVDAVCRLEIDRDRFATHDFCFCCSLLSYHPCNRSTERLHRGLKVCVVGFLCVVLFGAFSSPRHHHKSRLLLLGSSPCHFVRQQHSPCRPSPAVGPVQRCLVLKRVLPRVTCGV
jgi:hypothetical protein